MENKIKCLLISGEEDSGKTTSIEKIIDLLKSKNFQIIDKKDADKLGNYYCTIANNSVAIIISTGSDNTRIINNFNSYNDDILRKKENIKNKNIFILAPIRNAGDKYRKYFIDIIINKMNLNLKKDVVEIPLTKFNVDRKEYDVNIKTWYEPILFSYLKDILKYLFNI